jgi:hypothetical protein
MLGGNDMVHRSSLPFVEKTFSEGLVHLSSPVWNYGHFRNTAHLQRLNAHKGSFHTSDCRPVFKGLNEEGWSAYTRYRFRKKLQDDKPYRTAIESTPRHFPVFTWLEGRSAGVRTVRRPSDQDQHFDGPTGPSILHQKKLGKLMKTDARIDRYVTAGFGKRVTICSEAFSQTLGTCTKPAATSTGLRLVPADV